MVAMRFALFCSSIFVAVNALPATVLVGPRETLCFSQYAEKPETRFSLDVFVFQGDGIGVTVFPRLSDAGAGVKRLKSIFTAKISSTGDDNQNDLEFVTGKPGEYEICLANDRQFEQGTKHVMLNVEKKTGGKGEGASDTKKEQEKGTDDTKKEDVTIIDERLGDLQEAFESIRKHQMGERKSLASREAAAEENHKSMVRSSVMETVVLLLVSAGQIFFVRRWFQGKGTLLKQWS